MEYRACMLNLGRRKNGLEYDGNFGVDDLEPHIEVVFLYDEGDEIFAYLCTLGDNSTFVASTDYGEAEASSLRKLLPAEFSDNWSNILLASLDIDEIDDEGLEYFLYHPDLESDEPSRPFLLASEFSDKEDLASYIFVRQIFGNFELDESFVEEISIDDFESGNIEDPVSRKIGSVGFFTDYETETDQLCLIEA